MLEHMVDGPNQFLCRAKVPRQGMNRLGLITRRQVGVEVGTAKAVDCLLGVANHDQTRIRTRGLAVDF